MTKIDNLQLRQKINALEKSRAGSFRGAGNGFKFALDSVRDIISNLEARASGPASWVKPSPRLEISLDLEEGS